VIKSVAYFPSQCALNGAPVLQALLTGLQAQGIQCQENGTDADAAMIWSALWHGRMAPNQQIYEKYRAQNKPVIIVDAGALDRGVTWKIAINHVNQLGYYGHTENLDLDRPARLGVKLSRNSGTNPAILIAAQHRRSLQLADQNPEQWIVQQVEAIRKVSDRPIVVRPHPRSSINVDSLGNTVQVQQPQKLANTYDSFDINFDYHAVVNYCSGPGIQAAIAGTRPVVAACSLAFPVSVAIEHIDQPYLLDREQWLIEICHTEYTVEEIKQGLWIHRLKL
jgi:hypothetical protein